MSELIPPLVVEFTIDAVPDHAFATWVTRADLWWPKGHTMSGDPAAIVFESHVGGLIYERGVDGARHPWGEVLVWDPPRRIDYLWHLFFPRHEATTVSLTFTAVDGGTLVRLEQSGWDALGADGPQRRNRTINGWAAVTGEYRALVERPERSTAIAGDANGKDSTTRTARQGEHDG